jgi:hypothetical protein
VADARTGKRFPLELPIQIHATDSPEEQPGITGNVSAGGVYIRAEVPQGQESPEAEWREGAKVEFDITLPANAVAAQQDIRVHCVGRVVRVEKIEGEEARRGVACVIDTYEFVRG